jgi:8-oxo-dGTP pyrophosphatase MutT (NUDIX family)
VLGFQEREDVSKETLRTNLKNTLYLPGRAMAHSIETDNVFDVFQPGLLRGAERLPYAPHKLYFYVEHPVEGWRVYLRAACFIHELYRPYEPSRFLVVKRTDGDPAKATWEPPKGQMEGKDGHPKRSIMQLLKENIRREVEEEAKITRVRELTHTGLVIQSIEPDFQPNTYFQYHIFSGYAHPMQISESFDQFAWIAGHMEEFRKLRSDKREKDAIAWYDGAATKMMGRWSPTITKLYLKTFGRV